MERCLELSALSTQAGKTCKALSSCCGIGQILFPEETLTRAPSASAKLDASTGGEEQPVEVRSELLHDGKGQIAESVRSDLSKDGSEGMEKGTGTESDTALPDDVNDVNEERSASDESERLEEKDVGRSLLELLRSGAKPAEGSLSTRSVDSSSESQEQREEALQLPLQGVGCSSELWDYLVRPIMDSRHPKAFVGHEVFKGSPIPGTRPQVLVDRRKDTEIMAMFKPSGWATCSTPQWEGLEGNLIRYVWRYYDAPTAAPCHRLDKGTSGIVLVATNKLASKHICQQILNKTLVKQYVGLCHGLVTPGMGIFSAPLALSRADRPLGVCSTEGREAVTRFRVLGYFRSHRGDYSLVQVQIEHGRQHQIRLHMASLGHPIVADGRYNPSKAKDDAEICPRLFLHACYLNCTLLKVDSEEPEAFTVACHLPVDLREVLVSELQLDRRSSSELPLEAQQLCDALLFPEHDRRARRAQSYDVEELRESRDAMRRREEFMKRFGFNKTERAEVMRILSQLKTSKERSAALQQFRVLGQRTPDFIVGRFEKYVEGLIRWNQNKAMDRAPEQAEKCDVKDQPVLEHPPRPMEPKECELLRRLQAPPTHETLPADGPLRILTESVWCDVCGLSEKQVSVCTSSLALKIRQPGIFGRRAPCQPVRRRRQVRDIRQWTAKRGEKETLVEEEESSEDEDDSEEEPEPSVTSRRRWIRSGSSKVPETETSEIDERLEQAKLLEQTVRDLVRGQGGHVDGVWLAGKVAADFNMYVRSNTRRNDGSLKKWLMSIPGIVVENASEQNLWQIKNS